MIKEKKKKKDPQCTALSVKPTQVYEKIYVS